MLGGKAVLLHYEGRRLLGLNPTGSRIWELVDGQRSVEEIAEILAHDSESPRDAVESDVRQFIGELVSRDLLLEVAEPAGEGHPRPDRPSRGRDVSEEMQ